MSRVRNVLPLADRSGGSDSTETVFMLEDFLLVFEEVLVISQEIIVVFIVYEEVVLDKEVPMVFQVVLVSTIVLQHVSKVRAYMEVMGSREWTFLSWKRLGESLNTWSCEVVTHEAANELIEVKRVSLRY